MTMLKKAAAIVLAVAILIVSIPIVMLQVSAKGYDRVSDPSTMDGWKQYFGKDVLSTENAGGVWTDKSVFTDAAAFEGTGITLSDDGDNFLVALSAMASGTAVEGFSNVPTDVMLVLDLSSSVLRDQAALQSVNDTILRLEQQGRYNRVGVVAYDGEQAEILLELDRYEYAGSDTEYSFLKPVITNGVLTAVEVNSNVTDASGETVIARFEVDDAVGAYTQLGVIKALEELLAADPMIAATAEYFAGQARIPMMVLLSDGEPTVASTSYTAPAAPMIGATGYTDHVAQRHFLTQLTIAYAKERLNVHYSNNARLYTLGLGSDLCLDVLEPYSNDKLMSAVLKDPTAYTAEQIAAAKTNRAIEGYWELFLDDGKVDITIHDQVYTVMSTALEQGNVFPLDVSQKYYVDELFTATDAEGAADALEALLHAVDLQSRYYPTLVDGNEEISGYISFNDQIGEHMSVTDIKGILINNVLFSGAMLSRNFVTGGGDLGTFDKPTSLGDELVWAVQARLGIDTDTARDLLGLAYYHGQLGYKNDSDFSNYIGWYANAAGDFLGFWYDGMTTMPDPSDPSLTDATRPVYVVRSYGFLGAVDEEHGVVQSDMMYATVQVRENITTGVEEMLFSIPAALIPTVTYELSFDENGTLDTFNVGGAEHPIRLVYEVALDEEVDPVTVHRLLGADYEHQNSDGTLSFYTNAFETDNTVGYGKRNTNCYFTPSKNNARYYYTENALIYTDTNGTVYSGEMPSRDAVLYRAFYVYGYQNGPISRLIYERISPESLEKAMKGDEGWYVPAGTVHTMLASYVTDKSDNPTDTLTYANVPFVDTKYTYYVGATLGNNGRLTLDPETGLLLKNTVQGGTGAEHFLFTVTRTDAAETADHRALLYAADGSFREQAVHFKNGVAQVTLAHGDELYILGMKDGASYTVSGAAHPDYRLVNINGDSTLEQAAVTIRAHTLETAAFEHALRGNGSVTIVNRILHDFGASYDIPNIRFSVLVELSEGYADSVIAVESSADNAVTSVMTDENGSFTVTLGHTEQFELLGLKDGTVVTATVLDPPNGFTPVYTGAGVQGEASVTIKEHTSVSLIVSNTYIPEAVETVNIEVDGVLHLVGRENDEWLDTDVYSFELQRYTNGTWETIAADTVDRQSASFSFTQAMQAEYYTKSGVYSYQIIETAGAVADVLYDHSIHTFSVTVGDRGMCGQLHILDIVSHQKSLFVSGNETDGWVITTDFTNLCTSTDRADAVIDIEKQIDNPSQSDLVSLAGYRFGLFADDHTAPVYESDHTDMIGEARLIATFDAVGTYVYTLKELAPENATAGMQYSDEEYTVVIEVTEAENGILRAAVSFAKEDQVFNGAPVFTNRYAPVKATLLPEVHKVLIGRELYDSEFAVQIRDGDRILATGTNTADGDFVFDQPLEFAAIGDYYYDVVEVAGDVKGVDYDSMVYRLHVSVADGGNGELIAHYHVINTASDVIVFKNLYNATPAKLVIGGTKRLIGRELINEEFSFVLINGRTILSTSNYTDGTFRFEPITFYEVGDYQLSVVEVHKSTTHGIEFDDTAYEVLVSVTDDGSGVLKTQTRLFCNGEEVDEILFTNYYTTTPAGLTLSGMQYLEGRAMEQGEFAFELYRSDEEWSLKEPLAVAFNDENGCFAFETLTFEEAGIYHYLVNARHNGEVVDGVTYDTQVYRVFVVVTDNHRGTLSAAATIFDSSNEYAEAMVFRNTYEAPTTTDTTTAVTTTTTAQASVTTTTAAPVETTAATTTSAVLTTTTTTSETTTTATSNPPTGETTDVMLWIVLLFVSGGAAVSLAAYRKQEQ